MYVQRDTSTSLTRCLAYASACFLTGCGSVNFSPRGEGRSSTVSLSTIDLDEVAPLEIPTGPGDVKNGKDLYKGECKTCHGRKGEGKSRKESPPLRGQYSEYLARQIEMFKNRERLHDNDEDDEAFDDYSPEELQDILAFIATLDDK